MIGRLFGGGGEFYKDAKALNSGCLPIARGWRLVKFPAHDWNP